MKPNSCEYENKLVLQVPGGQCNVSQAVRKAERLLRLHEEMDAAPMTRVRTLYDAFQLTVLQNETLPTARVFASQAYEVAATALHPTSDDVVRYQKLARDPSSHRNYLLNRQFPRPFAR